MSASDDWVFSLLMSLGRMLPDVHCVVCRASDRAGPLAALSGGFDVGSRGDRGGRDDEYRHASVLHRPAALLGHREFCPDRGHRGLGQRFCACLRLGVHARGGFPGTRLGAVIYLPRRCGEIGDPRANELRHACVMRVGCLAAAMFASGMGGLAGGEVPDKPPACWPQFRGPNACGVALDTTHPAGRIRAGKCDLDDAVAAGPFLALHLGRPHLPDRFRSRIAAPGDPVPDACRWQDPVAANRAGRSDRKSPSPQYAGQRHAGDGRTASLRLLRFLWPDLLRFCRPRSVATAASCAADALRFRKFADRRRRIRRAQCRVPAETCVTGHRPPHRTDCLAARVLALPAGLCHARDLEPRREPQKWSCTAR